MKNKPESDLEAAWQFLEGAEVREDLAASVEFLWRGLYQLLDTLETVQESLPQEEVTESGASASEFMVHFLQ